jgi:hypothetical protein
MPKVREERDSVEQANYSAPRRQSFEQQLAEDTKQYVYDLYTAVRPSLREDAASALAGGRFASRPEVKQVLAKAVIADPAPSVKAHCIRLLSDLGYHEYEYVNYLHTCVRDAQQPILQVAASSALARLAPKPSSLR